MNQLMNRTGLSKTQLIATAVVAVIVIGLVLFGAIIFLPQMQTAKEAQELIGIGCETGTGYPPNEMGQVECVRGIPEQEWLQGYIDHPSLEEDIPLSAGIPQELGVEVDPSLTAASAAAAVDQQNATSPTPLTTQPPPPQRLQLAEHCESGYLVSNEFPYPEHIGKKGYRQLNDTNTGPAIQNKQYAVTRPNIPDHILVFMDTGAYYFPETWFQQTGEIYCTSIYNESFDAALKRLAPQQNIVVNLFNNDLFASAGYVLIAIMVAAPVLEVILKQRLLTIPTFALLVYVFVRLQLFVSDEGQLLLYTAGLVSCLALGNRETLSEIGIVLSRRRDRNQVPDDLEELLSTGNGLMKVIKSTDWSFVTWWTGFNIIWTVVGVNASPLALAMGMFPSVLFNTLATMVFLGLEAMRRGQKGDVIAFVIGVTVGLAIAVEFVIFQSILAVLITALLGAILIMAAGFSGRTALSRESIPEALGGISTMGLGSAILLSTLLS